MKMGGWKYSPKRKSSGQNGRVGILSLLEKGKETLILNDPGNKPTFNKSSLIICLKKKTSPSAYFTNFTECCTKKG